MIKYKLDYQNKIKIDADREVIYTISKKHRGRNKKKSYWSIPMPKEVSLFRDALRLGFEDKDNYTAWNLYIKDGEVCMVGYSVDRKELKIGKFVDSNKNEKWHGYPSNYMKNNQDIPPASVLLSWLKAGYITTATMKKNKRRTTMQPVEKNDLQLAPLKMVIPGQYYDCQIYRGKLYL